MTTVARLKVLLEADSHRLNTALRKVKGSISGVQAAMGALAGGGFAAMIKSGLDSADALQKMSLRTGVSVEALSALTHAADLSGVSVSQLDNGLSRMQRTLGDALSGVKGPAKAFADLNIDIEKFRDLKPEQQFAILAEQLSKVKDRAVQAKLGNEIFGRSFAQLLPLITGGASGLKEMAKSAQVLSTEGAAHAAAANDAMTVLSETVSGLARAFAVELAPSIGKAFSTLTQTLPNIIAAVEAAVQTVGQTIGAMGATVAALFRGDFAGAAAIGKISVGDIYREALDENAPRLPGASTSGGAALGGTLPDVSLDDGSADSIGDAVGRALGSALDGMSVVRVVG